MGKIPKVSMRRGQPDARAPRLEEQTIPGRTGQDNTNRGAGQPNGMRAADRTAPTGRVQLNTENNQKPKSPYDAMKGRNPTRQQIDDFIPEVRQSDITPPKAQRFIYNPDTNRMQRVDIDSTPLEMEPIDNIIADPTELSEPAEKIMETVFGLYLGDELTLDLLRDLMDDLPLMLKLEGFLQRTEREGEVVFNNTASQTVDYENGTIGMEEYHIETKAGDENRPTLHETLRARFGLPPLTNADAAPQADTPLPQIDAPQPSPRSQS